MHQSGDQLQKSGDEIDRAAADHLLKNQPFKKNRLAATVAPTVAHRCAAAPFSRCAVAPLRRPLRRAVAPLRRCAPLRPKKIGSLASLARPALALLSKRLADARGFNSLSFYKIFLARFARSE